MRAQALPLERIVGVETGGCPHTAIREDASINLAAVDDLVAALPRPRPDPDRDRAATTSPPPSRPSSPTSPSTSSTSAPATRSRARAAPASPARDLLDHQQDRPRAPCRRLARGDGPRRPRGCAASARSSSPRSATASACPRSSPSSRPPAARRLSRHAPVTLPARVRRERRRDRRGTGANRCRPGDRRRGRLHPPAHRGGVRAAARQAASGKSTTARVLAGAGLAPGMRCLDVGCGPGEVMRLMGRQVGPTGRVVGLDIDAALGAYCRRDACAPRGRRTSASPPPTSPAATRCPARRSTSSSPGFLLIHMTDPVAVARRLAALVAPGGKLVLMDYDLSRMAVRPDEPWRRGPSRWWPPASSGAASTPTPACACPRSCSRPACRRPTAARRSRSSARSRWSGACCATVLAGPHERRRGARRRQQGRGRRADRPLPRGRGAEPPLRPRPVDLRRLDHHPRLTRVSRACAAPRGRTAARARCAPAAGGRGSRPRRGPPPPAPPAPPAGSPAPASSPT